MSATTGFWSETRREMLGRTVFFGICAMGVMLGLSFWLFLWYGDIMPGNPPPCACEDAMKLFCIIAFWPLAALAWISGKGPHMVFCVPLLPITGLFWGFVIAKLREVAFRLSNTCSERPGFAGIAAIQIAACLLACAGWFYFRASRILAHPTDPENY